MGCRHPRKLLQSQIPQHLSTQPLPGPLPIDDGLPTPFCDWGDGRGSDRSTREGESPLPGAGSLQGL